MKNIDKKQILGQKEDVKKSEKPIFEVSEVADEIVKSIYKSILKTIKRRNAKQAANKVVNDVLDPNNVAQVDPDEIPSRKTKILYKNSKRTASGSIKKVKKFMAKKRSKVGKDEPIPGLFQKKAK